MHFNNSQAEVQNSGAGTMYYNNKTKSKKQFQHGVRIGFTLQQMLSPELSRSCETHLSSQVLW